MSRYDFLPETVGVFDKEFNVIIENLERNACCLDDDFRRLLFQTGFGMEGIKFRIKKIAGDLRKCSEQVGMEKQAIDRISVITQNADGYAHSILSGEAFTPKDMPAADYDKTGWVQSVFNFVNDGIQYVSDFMDNTVKVTLEFFEDAAEAASHMSDILKGFGLEHLGSLSDFLDALVVTTPVVSLVSAIQDGVIDLGEGFDIAEGVTTAFEPFVRMVYGAEQWEQVRLMGTTAQNASSWMPVIGAFLKIGSAGYEAYEKYGADGEMTTLDWSEAGIDVGVKGLIAVTEALVVLACPPAAIGVAVYETANHFCKFDEKIIDGIKSWADSVAQSFATA